MQAAVKYAEARGCSFAEAVDALQGRPPKEKDQGNRDPVPLDREDARQFIARCENDPGLVERYPLKIDRHKYLYSLYQAHNRNAIYPVTGPTPVSAHQFPMGDAARDRVRRMQMEHSGRQLVAESARFFGPAL
jgi:hypothetical protein